MAKGNLLQGMARGKVGDLVFSRMDGEQITRVRNRRPRNPKTNKQLYQRAIMATVSQLYAAGQEIFNHSFEGANTPADNQRRFMSENVKILRSNLANDLRAGRVALDCFGRFTAPGVNAAVPFDNMLVSDGSLQNPWFPSGNRTYMLPEPEREGMTQGEYGKQLGLVPGDIFTFIGFQVDRSNVLYNYDNIDADAAKQFAMTFKWAQFHVDNLDSLTDPLDESNVMKGLLVFDFTNTTDKPLDPFMNLYVGDSLDYGLFFFALGIIDFYDGVATCIRTKPDSPLRSKSWFSLYPLNKNGFGLISNYVLDAWKRGAVEVGDSDYILEGGDSHPITPTPAPTPTPTYTRLTRQILLDGFSGYAFINNDYEGAVGLCIYISGFDGNTLDVEVCYNDDETKVWCYNQQTQAFSLHNDINWETLNADLMDEFSIEGQPSINVIIGSGTYITHPQPLQYYI